jgi:ferredoxin-NADP reductase
MRIRLKEKRTETSDVISFIFDLGGQPLSYIPGQFVFFELDALAFPDERGKRRHFTISSSPTEAGIVMFTTRLRGSGFKETLRHAEPGYELTMETPRGGFVMREGDTRPHVMVAGGIGITPYRSILRHAADLHTSLRATLLYFNRIEADIIFRQELDSLSSQMSTLRVVHALDEPTSGWTGETSRLSEALLSKYAPNRQEPLFWLSGPPPMVNAYAEILLSFGIDAASIKKDSFTGY